MKDRSQTEFLKSTVVHGSDGELGRLFLQHNIHAFPACFRTSFHIKVAVWSQIYRSLPIASCACISLKLSEGIAAFLVLFVIAASISSFGGSIEVKMVDDEYPFRIPVVAFGKTNYFAIDTGTSITCFDPLFKSMLGKPIGERILDTAYKQDVATEIYNGPELRIGRETFKPPFTFCMDMELLSRVVGQACDGILGMDAMKEHVVSFDPDNRMFSITDAVLPEVEKTFQLVPLAKASSDSNLYVVNIQLNRSHSLNALLDSGTQSFLFLNKFDLNELLATKESRNFPSWPDKAAQIVGRQRSFQINEARIGTNVYQKPWVDEGTQIQVVSLLGYQFFRRHRLVFDFPKKVLYVAPSRYVGDALRSNVMNLSGLRILRTNEVTYVYEVIPGSPAHGSGLKANDQINSIGSIKANTLPMAALRELLQNYRGEKQISVTVNREGEDRAITFQIVYPKN